MARTVLTQRRRNGNARPSSPPRKAFAHEERFYEIPFKCGEVVESIMGRADGCEYYLDVVHPLRIKKILTDAQGRAINYVCDVLAFPDDPEWGVDTFSEVNKPSGPRPTTFIKDGWIQFPMKGRRVFGQRPDQDLEQVWVRGQLMGQTKSKYWIRHLNWETQQYTTYRWVHKAECRPDFS